MEKIIVIFGPSGAGKGEASRHVISAFNSQLEFSVSDASRDSRPGEVHGRDYNFIEGHHQPRKP
ncbi:MAG: hypothetical protein IT284_01845 [Bacteroidetes bacterium]|nr:hypothetical protein [Bacteroidota bacterium]